MSADAERISGRHAQERRAYMPKAQSSEWETPAALFEALDAEFGPFTCDPACTPEQHSARMISLRGGTIIINPTWHADENFRRDGLLHDWSGVVYLNPPYGRGMPRWIEKAVSEIEAGNCERVVALIPARTDTSAWQKFILREAAYDCMGAHGAIMLVRFLAGRVRFVGAAGNAPFPSAIVMWERMTP
ncbi:MAG: DNA N-6-adenine-methyltransferase [Gammaproteobacteria bacterium]